MKSLSCPACGKPMLWLPELGLDRWRCDACERDETTPAPEFPADRVEALTQAALRGHPVTRQWASAALSSAPALWLNAILTAKATTGGWVPIKTVAVAIQGICVVPFATMFAIVYLGLNVGARIENPWSLCVSLLLPGLGWLASRLIVRSWLRRRQAVLSQAASDVVARSEGVESLSMALASLSYPGVGQAAAAKLKAIADTLPEEDVRCLHPGTIDCLAALLDPKDVPPLLDGDCVAEAAMRILSHTSHAPAALKLRALAGHRLVELPPEMREAAARAAETIKQRVVLEGGVAPELSGRLREAAQFAAHAIEERVKTEAYNRSLLRAASPESDASTLLRPATGGEVEHERLLRPTDGEGTG